jgi:hypothetical protein
LEKNGRRKERKNIDQLPKICYNGNVMYKGFLELIIIKKRRRGINL